MPSVRPQILFAVHRHATERPFRVLKYAIDRPRHEMMDRINRRVDAMMEAGFENEATQRLHMRISIPSTP